MWVGRDMTWVGLELLGWLTSVWVRLQLGQDG